MLRTQCSPPAVVETDAVAISVVILLIGIFGACQGLSYPLLSLLLQQQGFDSAVIGFNSAMTPLGIVTAAPLLPRVTRRLGSAMTGLASTLALALLLVGMGGVRHIWFWFPARFLLGMAICGLYVTSETWINVLAAPAQRGRLLGTFTSILALGFACGPAILIATGSSGWPPFLALAGIMLVAAALVGAVRARLPDVGASGGGTIGAFLPLAPLLLFVVLVVAAYDQGVLTLFPIYGSGKGLDEQDIAVAITVWAAGNILFQIPIGWLSDSWSRRGTTILLCAATMLGAAALPLAMQSRWLLWAVLFVWGPASYGVYTVALIELGARFAGATLVAGNSAFAVMWGAGGMIGPPIFGAAMDRFGPEALPVGLVFAYAVLMAAVARRPAPP